MVGRRGHRRAKCGYGTCVRVRQPNRHPAPANQLQGSKSGYQAKLKRSSRQLLSVQGANGHPTPDLMGTGEVEFHTPGTLGRVSCKSYKSKCLSEASKLKKLPQRQRVGGGKTNAKVPFVRTRMEHSPQQTGLCSLPDYQVVRWYARPENHSFLPAYVRPQYAVPAARGLPHALQKSASFRALAQLPRPGPPALDIPNSFGR